MPYCRLASGAWLVAILATGDASRADQRRELTFAEAVRVALARNGDLYVAQAELALARDDIALAESRFDPKIAGSARFLHEDQPGNTLRFAWTDTALAGTLEYDGLSEFGTSYGVQLGMISDRYANAFTTVYNPATTTNLTLVLDQPLLRGGGRDANVAPIRVAARRAELTELELRHRIEDVISDVAVAYWNLALAYNEVDAREASLKLAEDQVAESQRLRKLGDLSEIDVTEAKAGVERMQIQLLSARQAVIEAEGKLRLVIVGMPDWKPHEVLVPIDSPAAQAKTLSIAEHVALARKNRPDIAAAHAAVETEQAGTAATSNARLPQLDLIATAGLIGFSGRVPYNYFTGPILDGTLGPTFTPDARFDGGPMTAVKNLASASNYTVSVGLKLELPLHNSAAEARHAHQEHALARAKVAEQAVLAQVENEVRTSIALLDSDDELRRTAEAAVTTNQQLLVGMRKRFTAGALTSFDVLRVADEVARSQIAAARARVSYQISLVRLARADGTLLGPLHITTASLEPTP